MVHTSSFSSSASEVEGSCSSNLHFIGNPAADLSIGPSRLPRPPSSIVIDRLYFEGGSEIIGGVHMAINVKEKPFWLEREKDYPSLLKWISRQPIVFYDTSSSRAWLIDGASALLHLVRISLYMDSNDPESTYDWVFDPRQLQDDWNGCTGRLAALKTLTNLANRNQNLYVVSKKIVSGQTMVEYSTLEERVVKILHCLEILIDRQIKVASQDGITIPQALPALKSASIVGFDTLDILDPLGPILPRIQHGSMLGHGWRDLVPAMGIMTIFGDGFGELIRPGTPSAVCQRWGQIPIGSDYLCTSLSTMKMLYEKRMTRMWPELGIGEVTEKIVWLSPSQIAEPCECRSGSHVHPVSRCQVNPVQYLMSKRLRNLRSLPRSMPLVDLKKLKAEGAVIFGHMSLLHPTCSAEDTEKSPSSLTERERHQLHEQASQVSSAQGSSGSSLRIPGTSTGTSALSPGTSQPSLTTMTGGSVTASNDGVHSDRIQSGSSVKPARTSKRVQWRDTARRLIRFI